MPGPLISSVWGIATVMVVFLTLSLVILAGIIIYGRIIRESGKRFHHLFNSVFEVLILVDEENRIIDVNDSASRLLGYSKRELLKSKLEEYIPQNQWRKLRIEITEVLRSGLDFIGETELICKGNGSLTRAEVAGTRIKIGESFYVLSSFRDITERWRAEESLKRKNITLTEVLTHLEEEKLKIKKEFASAIDQILLPEFQKIIQNDGKVNKAYYDSVKNNLQELSVSTGGVLRTYENLTPREIDICNLIKGGATSKEIAKALNISEATILKHRGRIRNKLKIKNSKINLVTFLKNLE